MSQQPIDDAARDKVIAALQRSRASGYLDDAGLNQRVEIALATDDPYQLNNLLADLPGMSAYMWTPSPNQQLEPVPPVAAQPTRQWQEFLRNYWGVLVGVGLILLLVFGNGYFSFWWMFVMLAVFFPRGMRSKMHRPQNPPAKPYQVFQPDPNGPYQPNPGQPYRPKPGEPYGTNSYQSDPYQTGTGSTPVADQFDADEDSGEGKWNQPPTFGKS